MFEKINWLPINNRFKECISSRTFNFFNNKKPPYMKDVIKQTNYTNMNSKTSFLKLNQPLQKSNHGQKRLSYIAPTIWKSLPDSLKATKGLNFYLRFYFNLRSKTIFVTK